MTIESLLAAAADAAHKDLLEGECEVLTVDNRRQNVLDIESIDLLVLMDVVIQSLLSF